MEKRIDLLNSVADDLVNFMNNYYSETESPMSVEGLKFGTQEGDNLDYIAYFNFGYSPAGEDLREMPVCFNGSLSDLQEHLENFGEVFDEEESVRNWLSAKAHGVVGVPDADELVEDAAIQKEFYSDLGRAFDGYHSMLSELHGYLADELEEVPEEIVMSEDLGLSLEESYQLISKDITSEKVENLIDALDEHAVEVNGEKHNFDIYRDKIVNMVADSALENKDFERIENTLEIMSDFSTSHYCEFTLDQYKLLSTLDKKNLEAVIKQIKTENLSEIKTDSLKEMISAVSQSQAFGNKR